MPARRRSAPDLTELIIVPDDIVVLRTFINEIDARVSAAILEAHGIPAQVLADTAGGAYPSMGLVFPARLLVHADDAALATEILDTPVDEATAEGEA